jgi:hypothetical protein
MIRAGSQSFLQTPHINVALKFRCTAGEKEVDAE